MSVDPATEWGEGRDLNEEIREALIATCHLSLEAVARIDEAARAGNMSFPDAAAKLDLVTAREIMETLVWVHGMRAARTPSLVEKAINRQGTGRALTVRHAGEVTPSSSLILAHDADNPRSERLRALRTELLLLNDQSQGACTLALVSPEPGEGRSQLCAELAIAFAQLGRKTLLVDADLRHPRQHALFDSENLLGLSQALAYGEAPQIMGVQGSPSMSILMAGPAVKNPLELISGGRFERLLTEWRRQYDFLVIDTPPVTQYADALAIATLAGSVLVVSRGGITPHRSMKGMLRRLGSTQSRVVGAVINNF